MDEDFMKSECVSCGACVQACPTATLSRKVGDRNRPARAFRHHDLRLLRRRLPFKAEMRGEEVVRMVPWKDGKANRGHSCVKGRFAYGYATHRDRIMNPMVRDKITDPWRETTWDEAIGRVASEFSRIQKTVWPRFGRRHHVVALHQRRHLRRAKTDSPGLRRQQRRHLRPRLPLADRLRPEDHVRRKRWHAGLRLGRTLRCHLRHRRQPDRWPSRVRKPHEEAACAKALS